ncbi:MAG: TonB family protein [Pyrinomonadaceae bacterium]
MKIIIVLIFVLCAFGGFAQTKQRSKTPVEILYGPAESDPIDKASWPVISGVLNSKASLEGLPAYPQKAKELKIEGRVEVQLLVNEDGEVIFANPLSGPEALWAEAVKAAVAARFPPLRVEDKPRKITGRIIFDFKKGKVELPYRNGFTG